MEKIIWKVEYTSLPRIKKYCKKCGKKSEFLSSELFRVNANQKNLDVWLIYNCSNCKTTWKQELYSRVKYNHFSSGILDKFYENNSKLAYDYSMNCNYLSKTGLEILQPDYSVTGRSAEIYTGDDFKGNFEIHLISDYQFDIKIISVLKKKLGISNSRLDYLIKNNRIFCNIDKKIKRCKLQKEQIIYLTHSQVQERIL